MSLAFVQALDMINLLMKDDYKVAGTTSTISVEIEKEVADKLKRMSEYKKLTESDIANTALKRFISTHKDFLPPSEFATHLKK